MIQYREIDIREAMGMLVDDINNLYFKTAGGSIDCVKDYTIGFDNVPKKQYFRKETIK